MRPMTAATAALVAAVLCCALLSGCGGSGEETAKASETANRRLDLLIADCSDSFRESSLRLIPEMVEIALDSAEKRNVLWSSCFAGAPLRTMVWDPKRDFGQTGEGYHYNDEILDRLNLAMALGLRGKLRTMVLETPDTVPGSGQLEALEVASEAPNVGRVFLLTDAAIHEPEVPELNTASRAELRETVDLWAPRLRGLRGVELTMLGAGYGVHNSASVRAGRFLFRSLAAQVGTASFGWTQELPPDFGGG
jgi:hypothetical protein